MELTSIRETGRERWFRTAVSMAPRCGRPSTPTRSWLMPGEEGTVRERDCSAGRQQCCSVCVCGCVILNVHIRLYLYMLNNSCLRSSLFWAFSWHCSSVAETVLPFLLMKQQNRVWSQYLIYICIYIFNIRIFDIYPNRLILSLNWIVFNLVLKTCAPN